MKLRQKKVYYKAFDKNLQCRGKQYKVGETYEEKGGKICSHGVMHFCPTPLDTADYYPLFDNLGNLFRWARINALTKIQERENKRACRKIKILSELNLTEFLKESIEVIKDLAAKAKDKFIYFDVDNLEAEKEYEKRQIGINAPYRYLNFSASDCKIVTTSSRCLAVKGEENVIAMDQSDAGRQTLLTYGGVSNTILSKTEGCHIYDDCSNSRMFVDGQVSTVHSSGSGSTIITSPDAAGSTVFTSGPCTDVILNSENSVACCFGGCSSAKGKIGDYIIFSGYNENGRDIRLIKIDGEHYKPDTFYQFYLGQIREVSTEE